MAFEKSTLGIVFLFLTLVTFLHSLANGDDDFSSLNGDWKCVSYRVLGEVESGMIDKSVRIENGRLTFVFPRKNIAVRIKKEGDDKSNRLVWRQAWVEGIELELEFKGIYRLEGDRFTICVPHKSDGPRPTEFSSTKDNGQGLIVLQRAEK